eukprot:TRINITY_DN3631_c0_g2_i11.p2 TRINITY_DN3631_c0_g2~~TRINITY_DN3631_c0_g2_i11.p2  ORF type:complete len:126 (-),score=28.09 TRINITY_DN3631_c0_g2_i11:1907-2284(-)
MKFINIMELDNLAPEQVNVINNRRRRGQSQRGTRGRDRRRETRPQQIQNNTKCHRCGKRGHIACNCYIQLTREQIQSRRSGTNNVEEDVEQLMVENELNEFQYECNFIQGELDNSADQTGPVKTL